jgi:hypothetical protein
MIPRRAVIAAVLAALALSGAAVAQPPADSLATRACVRAVRLTGRLTIDGILSEPAWQSGEPCTTFLQRIPFEGAPATLRTEVRVLYDDEALYVGARMFDSAPDSIVTRLSRRDASNSADRFAVYLDPFHDRRTGYYFMVNAAGTLFDGTLSNDVNDDKAWDGVWHGRARRDGQGWTVEMKIPTTSCASPAASRSRGGSTSDAPSRAVAKRTTSSSGRARLAASCRASPT